MWDSISIMAAVARGSTNGLCCHHVFSFTCRSLDSFSMKFSFFRKQGTKSPPAPAPPSFLRRNKKKKIQQGRRIEEEEEEKQHNSANQEGIIILSYQVNYSLHTIL